MKPDIKKMSKNVKTLLFLSVFYGFWKVIFHKVLGLFLFLGELNILNIS